MAIQDPRRAAAAKLSNLEDPARPRTRAEMFEALGVSPSRQTAAEALTPEPIELKIPLRMEQEPIILTPPKPKKGKNKFLSGLGDLIDIIDTPRAMIVSTIKETTDLFQGEGFSASDWWRQTSDNMMMGEVLRDWGVDLPMPLQFTLGLGLDIALDPLTYLTLGTAAARYANPKKVADALAAASKTAKTTNEAAKLTAAAGRVMSTKSIMSAGDDALKVIGMGAVGGRKAGIRMTVPGTGRLGRTIIEKPLRVMSKRTGDFFDAQRIKQLPEYNLPDSFKGANSPWAATGSTVVDFSDPKAISEVQAAMNKLRADKFADVGKWGEQARLAMRMPVQARLFRIPGIGDNFIKFSARLPGTAFGKIASSKVGQNIGKLLQTKQAYNNALRTVARQMANGNQEAINTYDVLRFSHLESSSANVKVATWQNQTLEQLRDVRMRADRAGVDFGQLIYQAADEPWYIADQAGNQVFNKRLQALGLADDADVRAVHQSAQEFWRNAGATLEKSLEPYGVKVDLSDFKEEFYVPRYLEQAEQAGSLTLADDIVGINYSTGRSNASLLSGQPFSNARIYVSPAKLRSLRKPGKITGAQRFGVSANQIDGITDEMIHNAAKANKLDSVAELPKEWSQASGFYTEARSNAVFEELIDSPMGVTFTYADGQRVSNRYMNRRLMDVEGGGSVRGQMESIGEELLGADYVKIYADPKNVDLVLRRYVNQASATLRTNMFLAALDNAGVTVQLDRLGRGRPDWFASGVHRTSDRLHEAVQSLDEQVRGIINDPNFIKSKEIMARHAERVANLDAAIKGDPPKGLGVSAHSRAQFVKASEQASVAEAQLEEIQRFVDYINNPNVTEMPSAYGMRRDVFELLRPATNNPSPGQRIFNNSVIDRVKHLENAEQAVNVTNDLAETINSLTQMRIAINDTLMSLDAGDLTKVEFKKMLDGLDDALEQGSYAVRELNLNYMDNIMENDVTVLFAQSYKDLADEVVRDTAYKITRNGRKLTQRTFRTPVEKELRNLIGRMRTAAKNATDPFDRARIRDNIDAIEDWLNKVTEVKKLASQLGESRLYSASIRAINSIEGGVTHINEVSGITEIRNQIEQIDELMRRSSGIENLDPESQKLYDRLTAEASRLTEVNASNVAAMDEIITDWKAKLARAQQRLANKEIVVEEYNALIKGATQRKEALIEAVNIEIQTALKLGDQAKLPQKLKYLANKVQPDGEGLTDYVVASQQEAIEVIKQVRGQNMLADAYGGALNDYVLVKTDMGSLNYEGANKARQAFSNRGLVGNFSEGDAQLIADAMAALGKMTDPEAVSDFMKGYNSFLTWWKAQAVTSPGFFMRNQMGGMWINNQMNDVPMHTHARVREIRKIAVNNSDLRNPLDGLNKLIEANVPVRLKGPIRRLGGSPVVSIDELKTFRSWFETGIAGQGQVTAEIGLLVDPLAAARQQVKTPWRMDSAGGAFGQGTWKFWKADFKPMNWVRARNSDSEFMLRGALAHNNMMNGQSIDEAWESVTKYHFDYADLTKGERAIKKVIPFWTWQKSILPLLVESIGRNPKAWGRLQQVKGELELHSDQQGLVPHWFGENMGMRLPFEVGGDRVYMMPDLPFRDLNRATRNMDSPFDVIQVGKNVGRVGIESALPPIKLPIELMMDQQVFGGIPFTGRYQQAPKWAEIPGIREALIFTGQAEVAKNGRLTMTDKNIYKFDQFLPLLGRIRRMAPNEEKRQDALMTTWINTVFGAGIRVNTPRMKKSEYARRAREYAETWRDNNDREWRNI